MFKFIICFGLLIIFFNFSACSSVQKIEALKPEPDDAKPLLYENKSSFVGMPISIKLQDVENQTNKLLTGLIYDDNKIEDDNLTVKIWKLSSITLDDIGGKIKIVLPLKVQINYRYGIDKLGVALYDTREINLNGNLNLKSEVTLSNWKMNTKTEFVSLDWNESPSITIAGKNIPITYLINPALKLFRSKIEKNIDDAIKSAMDFKPNVMQALQKISAPLLLNPEYETWLRIVPNELFSTKAVLKNKNINLLMALKCNLESIVGQKPESKFDADQIVLQTADKIQEKIDANIVAVSTYKDASNIMTKNFGGQIFENGNKKVTVQNVNIWHKNGKMVIALSLLGSINGTVYLTGFPQYNSVSKEIYFDKLDYVLDTKSKLLRTANWLASGLILKKIQENCRYSLVQNLEDGKQNMLRYLKNYSPTGGVFVNGTLENITFQKIELTNKAIIAFLNVSGTIRVAVDGL